MSEKHVILLANFYGSYLNKSRFRASVIVNNAGIEQLATVGVEKIEEVKSQSPAGAEIHVLMVAGLTDVLIKSVEEGKNKLEITPNSSQLIETKMKWAQTMLQDVGAKVIWTVMPPISLRMYHHSEGWNINKVPGMSNGLDREQRALNQLMLDYRLLCLKFNRKDGKKIVNGPFFTDLVVEYSTDKTSMHLNTSMFESDGISPTTKLISHWTSQIEKLFVSLENKVDKSSALHNQAGSAENWNLPPPRDRRSLGEPIDRGVKRGFGDNMDGHRSLLTRRRDEMPSYDGDGRDFGDREYNQYDKRPRNYSPPATSNIPSLLNMGETRMPQRRSAEYVPSNNYSGSSQPGQGNEQVASAVQLLAATMQLSGGNSANVKTVFNALMAQQQQERRETAEQKRREEEARQSAMKRKYEEEKLRQDMEEARRREVMKRLEETKRLEEVRRRDEERRRQQERIREEEHRVAEMRRHEEEGRRLKIEAERRLKEMEENRLREVQIAAKLAMEQQRIRQEQRQRQAQMTLMAVTRKVQEQIMPNVVGQIPSILNMGVVAKPGNMAHSALDRINEKLRNDREKRVPDRKLEPPKPDKRMINDPEWSKPIVLFSFLNRAGERKPLRGVLGAKLGKGAAKALSDYRSRSQVVYKSSNSSPVPAVNYLNVRVKRPGDMTPFEAKIANFNNRVLDMMEECESLLLEGRSENQVVRREVNQTQVSGKVGNFVPEEESKSQKDSGVANNSGNVLSGRKESGNNTTNNKEPNQKPPKLSANQRLGAAKNHNSPVIDLRETLNKSHTRSSDYSTVTQRESIDSKPRWDKSDESEDELLWDDDESSVKPVEDEDDAKIPKEHMQHAANRNEMEEEETRGNNQSTDPTGDKRAVKDADSVKFGLKKDMARGDSVESKDDFVTFDDSVDPNVGKPRKLALGKSAPVNDNFVTIDES